MCSKKKMREGEEGNIRSEERDREKENGEKFIRFGDVLIM